MTFVPGIEHEIFRGTPKLRVYCVVFVQKLAKNPWLIDQLLE